MITKFDFRYNSAIHPPDLRSGIVIELEEAALKKAESPERHTAQQKGIPDKTADLQPQPDTGFVIPLRNRYIKVKPKIETTKSKIDHLHEIKALNGERVFTNKSLYLFNVIVALEWAPSPRTFQQLSHAFRQVSDLLYDVTDGQMALGQVIIGDCQFMQCADAQIMASNRYYPRSWVDGLMDEQKYTPVRLGRGWWRKDLGITLPWSDPVGARVIVHEWCHYALGLLDEYLENRLVVVQCQSAPQTPFNPGRLAEPGETQTLVFVRPGLATDSIMDNLEGSSEIVPQGLGSPAERRSRNQERINRYFADIDLSGPVLEGPAALPLDLPHTVLHIADRSLNDLKEKNEEWLLKFSPELSLQHCWGYVLRPHTGEAKEHTPWAQVIPQGALDACATTEGFLLLGARPGDELCLIGAGHNGEVQVLHRSLNFDAGKREATLSHSDLPETSTVLPVVTVIPEIPEEKAFAGDKRNTAPHCKITLRLTNLPPAAESIQAWVFPLGRTPNGSWPKAAKLKPDGNSWVSDEKPFETPSLDGQVLLKWVEGGKEKILIAEYSEGGGPATSVRDAPEPPISAGSSEGNLMFYFAAYAQEPGFTRRLEHSKIRIVTTRNYGEFNGVKQDQIKPRSYLFSVAASQGISVDQFHPTLVFSFDAQAVSKTGELYIYSYIEEKAQWELKPTYQPWPSFRAAHPLTGGNGVALDPKACPSYYYRLFFYEGPDSPPEAVTAMAGS